MTAAMPRKCFIQPLRIAIAAGLIFGVTAPLAMTFAAPADAGSVSGIGGAESRSAGESPADVGTGTLFWGPPGSRQPLPVLDIQVEIDVTGLMVHGAVTQAFANPTPETIDALYVFPLPEKAAVHHMEIRIGERRIVSMIQEKEAARATYQAARAAGRKAALLEQGRPNLFTTAVAGVNPGEKIEVQLEYVEELDYDNGAFALVFPLTYTSRYHPPTGSVGAGGEPAISRDGMPAALPPQARLTVRLNTGLPLEEPVSASHAITWWWDNEILVIEPESRGPIAADRDFHLRFAPQVGREPQAAVMTEDRHDGRYALLMLLPPGDAASMAGLATETLFVVDISGSMRGPSMEQARAALDAAIRRLHPEDRFNILAFNDGVLAFAADYVPAGEREQEAARRWIHELAAMGGTRIDLALDAGLEMVGRQETWRVARMVFLTDGAVSTEDAVVERIQARLGSARLHTLGIGAAPNRYLLRRMALAGKGLCHFIFTVDQAKNEMDEFLARLARPVMTDIQATWEGEQPLEVYPQRLPDLHAGDPLVVSARFAPGAGPGRVILDGRLADSRVHRVLDVKAGAVRPTGIATRWARHKIEDLLGSLTSGDDPDIVRRAVTDVSRDFGVVTRYTSLVAVEEFSTANGDGLQVRVNSAAPAAGILPLGGTREPLLRLVMVFCALAAAASSLAGLALRRCRGGDKP